VEARGRIDVKQRPDKDGKMHPSTAEDAFAAFMTLDNGASVVIDTAWATAGTLPDHWSVFGTEGIIDVTERIQLWVDPMVRDTEIRLVREREEKIERLGPFDGDAHLPSMRPYAVMVREAVTQRRQIEPSFAAGVAASEVVDRLHASINARAAR